MKKYWMSLGSLIKAFLLFVNKPTVFLNIFRFRREGLTYLSVSALVELSFSVLEIEQRRVPGLIIEAGCAMGGSSLILTGSKDQERAIYIYDTFGMIPPPSDQDGVDVHQRYEEIVSGKSKGLGNKVYYGYIGDLYEVVRQLFFKYNLPPEKYKVNLVKGLFEDTLHIDTQVALAHIDCDWYESVKVCLQRIEPKLAKGGVLVIDDYYDWSGCRKAVDEYFLGLKSAYRFSYGPRLTITRRE